MFVFPDINPVAFSIGNLDVYWYAVAYIIGILLAYRIMLWLNQFLEPPAFTDRDDFGDIISWAVLGIIIGGRVFYALFYEPRSFLAHPIMLLQIWKGGMSFHGGMVGLVVSLFFFCRRYDFQFLRITDLASCVAPIGICLGRIANFINGELYGKVTDVPWAVIFTHVDNLPRHPSQIYEALSEGVLLFCIMIIAFFIPRIRGVIGRLSSIFLLSYGLIRLCMEHFRDTPGFALGLSMGSWLSLPMVIGGLALLYLCRTNTRI